MNSAVAKLFLFPIILVDCLALSAGLNYAVSSFDDATSTPYSISAIKWYLSVRLFLIKIYPFLTLPGRSKLIERQYHILLQEIHFIAIKVRRNTTTYCCKYFCRNTTTYRSKKVCRTTTTYYCKKFCRNTIPHIVTSKFL